MLIYIECNCFKKILSKYIYIYFFFSGVIEIILSELNGATLKILLIVVYRIYPYIRSSTLYILFGQSHIYYHMKFIILLCLTIFRALLYSYRTVI